MLPKIICIANQKGGVGKTTTSVSLAHGFSQKGRRVLLIDLDPQGQSATALGHNPEPGAFYLLTMGSTPHETTFVQSWVRFSGREGLYLLPGNQQTMAAQTVFNAHDKPISAIRQSTQRFFKGGLQVPIHRATLLRKCAAEGQTIFEVDPLCRAAKEYQALTQLVMKY